MSQKILASVDFMTIKNSQLIICSIRSVLDKYGGVDVLVNNAGSMGPLDFKKGENKGQGPLDGALCSNNTKTSERSRPGIKCAELLF